MKTILLSSYLKFAHTLLIVSIFLASTISSYAQGAGNALVFDGNDNVVLVPSSSGGDLNPLDSITLECWIYLNEEPSVTHRPHFLTKTGSYALIIENNGLVKFYIHDDIWYYSTGTTVIVANKWYHIAGTYDGENIKIYVNGKLDGTPFQHAGSMVLSNNDLKIGNRLENEEALNGSMDEIRAWTGTRSEAEIQESMNKILIGDVTKLVGHWRLNETTGTVAIDTSGLGNDGTLTNMIPETSRILSSAPVGDASIYSVSGDIIETNECEVDVIFGTEENSPGDGYSLAAIQVDGPPNDNTGLTNIADTYWELWSENQIFDGIFSATVKFHYDKY